MNVHYKKTKLSCYRCKNYDKDLNYCNHYSTHPEYTNRNWCKGFRSKRKKREK